MKTRIVKRGDYYFPQYFIEEHTRIFLWLFIWHVAARWEPFSEGLLDDQEAYFGTLEAAKKFIDKELNGDEEIKEEVVWESK